MAESTELMTIDNICNRVYVIRGQQVMLDCDLAEIYGYEVKRLNEQVKRNITRFPEDFMFQLTKDEIDFVKSQFATSRNRNMYAGQDGGRRKAPYAFTEQGIYMLATVLRGELAEQQSIFIMRAFREMRHYIKQNQQFVTQSEIRLFTAKVSEISVQVAGVVDWKNKAEDRFDNIQRSIDTLSENFVSEKDFKNFVIYKGQKFEADAAYIDIYQQANMKTYSLDHEHILSGIIKCPICGSGMYGNVNRKKHPDGGYYRDYFYYACKHRTFVNGHKCTYLKQWNEDKINAAVEEVIRKLVNNPKFKTEIQKYIGQSIDTQELDREHTGLQERLKQVIGAKNKLANQMDNLSVSDKHYDKKYEDIQIRLDKLYDEIEEIETAMEAVETRLYNIRQEKLFGDNVYQFLLFFDKLYDRFTDMEKKTFMKNFLKEVNIYEEEQEDGRILKGLKFRFPVFFINQELYELDWDNESTVETVCLIIKTL